MMLLSITLFFLPFLETFQSKYVLVSLDKSKSPLITGRAQRSDEEGEWLTLQNVHNDKFIGDPVIWKICAGMVCGARWDRGIMDLGFKKVYRTETSGKPGHHMICDVNGNGLKWSDVNDGMRVKLRTKRPHFEGYEYLYTSEIGHIYYDKLSNNLKQFWRVKKREDAVFLQSEYHLGEYLSGTIKELRGEPAFLFVEEGMDLSKTGWRIIPVQD